MEHREFVKACQPWNIKYRELFHYIPDPADYYCTREQFLQALQNAVETKNEIDRILTKITNWDNTQYMY